MKKSCLLCLALLVGAFSASAWGACPEDTLDRGDCDTMYIEPWEPDVADTAWARAGEHMVKVPIYVTADIFAPYDSIDAFIIPLCFTHTNPSKYCSVSAYWNTAAGSNAYNDTRGIFRHLPNNTTPTVHNWMRDLWQAEEGSEWDGLTLDLDGTSHFWLGVVPSGTEDQRFMAGSKILLATMTMKLEDTMHICVDTCFWPPHISLAFGIVRQSGFGGSKIPRSGNGTYSFRVCFPTLSDVWEIEDVNGTKPSNFSLSQNYPNPFNPVTNFEFHLSQSSHVKIEIFNIVGQKVKVLVDEDMKPGVYLADWDSQDENGKTVSSGIYFYRMQAGDFADTKKMVLMK